MLATLGRIDLLAASGQLERLLASGAAPCEQALLLSALADGPSLTLRRIGAPPSPAGCGRRPAAEP